MKQVFTEDIVTPKGLISSLMYLGNAEFVQLGTGHKQGYFKLPKEHVVKEMHIKNLIVDKASILMAKRMRPGVSWGDGINYLELGTGVGTGTTQIPQIESSIQTILREPLMRKAVDSWTYLDSSGNPVVDETNVLQLSTTFMEAEANGAIVEMGLFGGDATVTAGSGYMFNYKTFPVWNKENTLKLIIVWKLTF